MKKVSSTLSLVCILIYAAVRISAWQHGAVSNRGAIISGDVAASMIHSGAGDLYKNNNQFGSDAVTLGGCKTKAEIDNFILQARHECHDRLQALGDSRGAWY